MSLTDPLLVRCISTETEGTRAIPCRVWWSQNELAIFSGKIITRQLINARARPDSTVEKHMH
jgi:hypothetical protein